MKRIIIGVSEAYGEANISEAMKDAIMEMAVDSPILALDILQDAIAELQQLYNFSYDEFEFQSMVRRVSSELH